jgi:catechol 2,3-dioxygenase-like lactoylglutathione lyase family enzyme
MAVIGAHVLVYTPEADAARDVLRDVLGWRHVDAGGGWLIFALPPAEVAVHPAEEASHELTLICDDLDATLRELRAKGIEIARDPRDDGWGITAVMVLPGGVEIMLYEPRHPMAIEPTSR